MAVNHVATTLVSIVDYPLNATAVVDSRQGAVGNQGIVDPVVAASDLASDLAFDLASDLAFDLASDQAFALVVAAFALAVVDSRTVAVRTGCIR